MISFQISNQQNIKTLDERINHLFNTGVYNHHRTIFFLIGNKQYKNLPKMVQIQQQKSQRVPNILWCYSDRQFFQQYQKSLKQQLQQYKITYCNYRDTESVLGTTNSILILQDFSSLTPNILAQTIETVQGGGIILFLMTDIQQLEDIANKTQKISNNYKISSQTDKEINMNRFNERFIKLLAQQDRILCLDENFNVIELGKKTQQILNIQNNQIKDDKQLQIFRSKMMQEDNIIKQEASKCACTLDQAKVVCEIIDLLQNKNEEENNIKNIEEQEEKSESEEQIMQLKTKEEIIEERKLKMLQKRNKPLYEKLMKDLQQRNIDDTQKEQENQTFPTKQIFLKAARGRGKSALLGMISAASILLNATNIMLFAPQISNVQTVFEFAIKLLKQFNLHESIDYQIQYEQKYINQIIITTNNQRQKICFIGAEILQLGTQILNYADLIIVDEAAAIPIQIIKKLIDQPIFTIFSSTISGYEGTGRALQIKVIDQLRRHSGNNLVMKQLDTPIRYNSGDNIEAFLNQLLLLDCETFFQQQKSAFLTKPPLPQDCQLYQVSRDALFSGSKPSESFLKVMWSIFISAHYKNSPNDLILASDHPNHRLFVLLGPIKDTQYIPIPLVVLQVSFEGGLSEQHVTNKLNMNQREQGNLTPWLISQDFLDPEIPQYKALRIVRIACNPQFQDQGYGSMCLQLLTQWCQQTQTPKITVCDRDIQLQLNQQSPLSRPPLLYKLNEIPLPQVDYLSTSFGLTTQLYNFYNRQGYELIHIKSNITAVEKYSCLMIQLLNQNKKCYEKLKAFLQDFTDRFLVLLQSQYNQLDMKLAVQHLKIQERKQFQQQKQNYNLNEFQLRRIKAFTNNQLDFNSVYDLFGQLKLICWKQQKYQKLNSIQLMIFTGVTCQNKSVNDISKELNITVQQIYALFVKAINLLIE